MRVGRTIARVEDDRIDARVGEHLGVLSQHGSIIAQIVAEDRFTPMVRRIQRSPRRRSYLQHRLWIGSQYLAVVERAVAFAKLIVPEEVEHGHGAIAAQRPAVTDVGTMRLRASVATQVSLKLSQTGSCGSVPPTFAIPSTSPQANHSPAWCVRHAVPIAISACPFPKYLRSS